MCAQAPHTPQALNRQLLGLKKHAMSFRVLQKATREKERKVMAAVYWWWRAARDVTDYLDGCYLANNISYNKTQTINFRPLLRLVSDNEMEEHDLHDWSKALRAIHADVDASPKHYAHNPIANIASFVKLKGGKQALARAGKSDDEDEGELDTNVTHFYTLNEAEFLPTLQQESKEYYSNPHANQKNINLAPLNSTRDGYSLVLVQQNDKGAHVIGSSNDAAQIDALLTKKYREDLTAVPLPLRCVLEPLHIANVPHVLATSVDKFIEYSNLKDKINSRKNELAHKRLIYRADTREFIVSCLQTAASVVIRAKPHKPVLVRKVGDVFLDTSVRKSIETRLLHQSMFNLFSVSDNAKFQVLSSQALRSHTLILSTKVEISDSDGVSAEQIKFHTTNLTHPSISFMPFYAKFGEARWQVINKEKEFTPQWTARLELNWLKGAVNAFVDEWLAEYGRKSNRAVNKTMSLTLTAPKMVLGYEFTDKKGFDNKKALTFDRGAAKGKARLSVRASDFAFALKQIADLEVTGKVTLQANANAVALSFATEASAYECWIPSCNTKGVRSSKHFTAYKPTQSADSKWFELMDKGADNEPEMAQDESKKLTKRIKQLRDRAKRK